jgi:predicted AlkP superfamily phosphohydrolase/phosphomutase
VALEPARDRPRVILLGIDGADWDRIERSIARAGLPSFERLMRGGVRASPTTLTPTYSPAIWTSIVTGVPPEVHGIDVFYLFQLPRLGVRQIYIPRGLGVVQQFLNLTGDLKRVPVTSSMRRRKAIWNLADEAGLKSAVVGLWATWPPEPLEHGLLVSDHASLARRYEWLSRRKTSRLTAGTTMYPAELEQRFAALQRDPSSVSRDELGQFLEVDDAVWEEFQKATSFSKGVDISAFRSSHLNDSFHLSVAEQIWLQDEPDLMVVYIKAIDELSHFFYKADMAYRGEVPQGEDLGLSPVEIERYGPVVDRIYAWTDRQIAPLVDLVDRDPNTLLIVVSDHGWEKEPDGGYNHNFAPPGILILYGADICVEGCPPLEETSIYDVTPTILQQLGLPLSEELVGVPLPAFRTPRPTTSVAMYGPPLSAGGAVASDIDPELTEKLEALGYLD